MLQAQDKIRQRTLKAVQLIKLWILQVESEIMKPVYCNFDLEISCYQLSVFPYILNFISRIVGMPIMDNTTTITGLDAHILDTIYNWARVPAYHDPGCAVFSLYLRPMPGQHADLYARSGSYKQTSENRERMKRNEFPINILFDD